VIELGVCERFGQALSTNRAASAYLERSLRSLSLRWEPELEVELLAQGVGMPGGGEAADQLCEVERVGVEVIEGIASRESVVGLGVVPPIGRGETT